MIAFNRTLEPLTLRLFDESYPMTKENPFPGMNPFLEAYWPDVHTRLIAYISDEISEQLPPGLKARTEERVALAEDQDKGKGYRADVAVVDAWRQGRPPVWQGQSEQTESGVIASEPMYCICDGETERWIEISDRHGRVITVIEVLSPDNKGTGRERYQAKRRTYLAGGVSVVEIDLLRAGSHTVNVPREQLRDATAPYITCVTRALNQASREYYQSRLDAVLPNVRIPLRPSDADAVLPLQPLLNRCYRMGGYWNESFTEVPGPPLTEDESAWVKSVLKPVEL